VSCRRGCTMGATQNGLGRICPVDDRRKRELRLIRGWLRRPPKTFAARMAFHHLKRKHGFSTPSR
jgi:hypothetical protein